MKVAAFCDSVIEGKDGVLSLIRVVDRLIVAAAGPDVPSAMAPIEHKLTLVLMLISGTARGSLAISLHVEPPAGIIRDLWSTTVLLEGEDRGANLVAELVYPFEMEGIYWFHVRFDDKHVTSLPFRIIYRRVGPANPPR